LRGLERQAAALGRIFPGLELRRELANPLFARMTSPMVGIPVEAAYHAVHHRELTRRALQVAAEKTARQIASAIRSGARRPREAGSSAQAPSVTAFDYTRASQTQREDLKRRIRAGEKVSPGQEFR
ncbi:MAG: hypothetical protein IKZ21_03055, partial [Clostridia bacterium]|nr:hypothetical protein [Clostridia bacterium]